MAMTVETLGVCRDCTQGAMRVIDPDEEFLEAVCDACGYRECVHRRRVDPEARRLRLHDRAAFPVEFAGRAFCSDGDNREAITAVTGWIRSYCAWRVARADDPDCSTEVPPAPAVWGRQGRGKTHLLVRIGERLINEADCTVLFRTARGLLRELRDFDGVADETWARALSVDVLLLDDLGAQRATDWRDDQLAELIDERHSRRLPVALTINAPPGAWEQLLETRTVSRLRGITFPVELDGDRDRRVTPLPSGPNQ
jgi:hypothetical protein